jgi:hypothetical protein
MEQLPVSISIAILRIGDGWRVISDGGSVGDFPYRVDAEEAALRFAAAAEGSGRTVEILLQQPSGELRSFARSNPSQ